MQTHIKILETKFAQQFPSLVYAHSLAMPELYSNNVQFRGDRPDATCHILWFHFCASSISLLLMSKLSDVNIIKYWAHQGTVHAYF